MSSLYLIRHGQAGTRSSYDTLSEVGRTQARLLGEYLAGQNLPFEAVYSGGLERQRQTAEEVYAAYRRAGAAIPDCIVDPGWNEFDLAGIYEAIAPRLNADDPDFRREHAAMLRTMAADDDAVNRRWNTCDIAVAKAWMERRYDLACESWIEFQARIAGRIEHLRAYDSGAAVAVFTSATPIAILSALSLGVADGNIMKMAGVMYNSAITTLRLQPDDLTLFVFNAVPHLRDRALRSFR